MTRSAPRRWAVLALVAAIALGPACTGGLAAHAASAGRAALPSRHVGYQPPGPSPSPAGTLPATATATIAASSTATIPATATATIAASSTATIPAAATATIAASSTATIPATATATIAASSTATIPATATATIAASSTATIPATATATIAASSTATIPATATATATPGMTARCYLPFLSKGACLGPERAVDLVLVLDTSQSMTVVEDGRTRLDVGRAAARALIARLDPTTDRVAVIAFDAEPHLLQPLAFDAASATRAVDGIAAGAGTRLDRAIHAAQAVLNGPGRRATAARVVVLLTDGRTEDGSEAAARAAARDLAASEAMLYAFGLGSDVAVALLRELASPPDGYLHQPDAATLDALFRRFAAAPGCAPPATVAVYAVAPPAPPALGPARPVSPRLPTPARVPAAHAR